MPLLLLELASTGRRGNEVLIKTQDSVLLEFIIMVIDADADDNDDDDDAGEDCGGDTDDTSVLESKLSDKITQCLNFTMQ